jgi:hypothetical protein
MQSSADQQVPSLDKSKRLKKVPGAVFMCAVF